MTQKDSFSDIWDNYDFNYHNPLLADTIGKKPLSVFLKEVVSVYSDIIPFSGFEKGVIEFPVFVFTDYNGSKINVINLMDLSFFEVLKYIDYLVVEDKDCGVFILRGKMPDDFYHDRAIIERWCDYIQTNEKRHEERRTTGWIPDAEIGR